MVKPIVYLVGHNVIDLHFIAAGVSDLGCEVKKLERTCSQTIQHLTGTEFDLLIMETDKFFPFEGADQLLLKSIREVKPSLPIIMLCPSGMREDSHQEVVKAHDLIVVSHDRQYQEITANNIADAVLGSIV